MHGWLELLRAAEPKAAQREHLHYELSVLVVVGESRIAMLRYKGSRVLHSASLPPHFLPSH